MEENFESKKSWNEDFEEISENWLERLIENIKDNPAIIESTKKEILAMLEDDE